MKKTKEILPEAGTWAARWNAALVSLHANIFDDDGFLKPEFSEEAVCPVCGSENANEYCVKDRFRYWVCSSCGMVYMNPRLNSAATLAFYNCPANEIYNETKFHASQDGSSEDDKINFENLQLLVDHVGSEFCADKLRGKKVLEIGCAKGYFLNRAKELGAEVFGIELNKISVEIARQTLSDHVYDRDLFELNLPDDEFDVVYSRDLIEHIHDPLPFLKEVSRIMKPGATLFMETHNVDGLIHRIVRGKHTCIFGFEHPVHWSPKTLSLALNGSGFETQHVQFESLDFRLSVILQYFRESTFTTIFPWSARQPLNFLLRATSAFLRAPGIRFVDKWLMRALATHFKAGSTMKVIAYKRQALVSGVS
jgi:2-polyprenyl-3-methyl-5-hydroxy-6-metoxy-1,4-benzoquinol methylase